MAPARWNLLVSSSLRPISSPVTNISTQSVTFLRHKTSLIFDLGLASSTKYRTATPSATTWRLSASISSRRQRSIGMISCNKFLSNRRLLYWTKSQTVSGYSTPNVSHVSPQIGPRKASVFGSCRSTAAVRSSLLSLAQRDGKQCSLIAASHTQQNQNMLLLKWKHYLWFMDWSPPVTSDNLVLATDHKPLLGVLNNRHLGDIKNERLLSLKEKTLPHCFSIFHIPGQNQKAPDTNSRKPTGDSKKLPLDSDFEE